MAERTVTVDRPFVRARAVALAGVAGLLLLSFGIAGCNGRTVEQRSKGGSQAHTQSAPGGSGSGATDRNVIPDELFVAGAIPPPLELPNMKGAKVNLDSYKGKVVLLNFWATWCVPCVAEMPALERLYKAHKERGFEVVAISVDPPNKQEAVDKFIRDNGITFTILRDTELSLPTTFGLTGFPESFFIGRDGKIAPVFDPTENAWRLRVVGDRPWDSPAFMRSVAELLGLEKASAEAP